LTEKLGSLEQRLGKMTWISDFSFKYTESLPVGLKGQIATDFQCDGDSVPIGGGAWNVHDAAVYQNENKDREDGNVWRVGAANLSGMGPGHLRKDKPIPEVNDRRGRGCRERICKLDRTLG
jgi:hypothetical protein